MNNETKPADDIITRITKGVFDLRLHMEQFKALQEGNLRQYMRLRGYDLSEQNKKGE